MKKIGIAHFYPCSMIIHICPCSVFIHIYPRLLNKILKRIRLWIHGQKAIHPCSSLIMHIYPCSLTLHIYSCSVVMLFIPVLISSWSRKGCSIKYRKGWKWEKIGIREGKAQIHPCSLILHIFSLFSGHTYLSLFSSPVGGEKAAQ